MPSLAAIGLVIFIALALAWKLRCIWRGCTVEPPPPGPADTPPGDGRTS